MSAIGRMNVSLEISGCVMSLVVAVCLLAGARAQSRRDRMFLRVLFCNAGALLFDAAAWLFKGRLDSVSWWGVRLSNFLGFTMNFLLLLAFSQYLTAFLLEHIRVSPWPTRIVRCLCLFFIALVVLSQFNGMFYTIDEGNIYHRGDWFWLTHMNGLICMGLNAGLLLRYRRALAPRECAALGSYIALPLLAISIQMFVYGIALLNLVNTIGILLVFLFVQLEQTQRMKERELALDEARVSILLSQIQPHFLFNVLTTVKGLCATDPRRAEEAVDRLSIFLRGNMNSLSAREPIPFALELEHLRNYLALEQLRFGERITVIYDLGAMDFMIPTLTLQPIVENAVRHGVTKRPEGGTVTICTRQTDSAWEITVTDDGVGFAAQTQNADGSHAGIENVRARLLRQCGGSLKLMSVPGQGTTALIAIPKERKQA